MDVLSVQEVECVSGGIDLSGVSTEGLSVRDQTLAGYQAEYGIIMGTAYFSYDQGLMAAGFEPVNTPPAR